jgi:hypothetical protein
MNEQATIGDNNPPETPFDISTSHINDLYDEAVLWLDGDAIESEEMAEGIAKVMTKIRAAEKERSDFFKDEKGPLFAAGKACDDKWRPLADRTKLAIETCKKALAPWLKKKADEKAEADRLAREKADAELKAAQEKIQAAAHDNLKERADAEEVLKAAQKTDRIAKAKANKGFGVSGGGRKVSLRTVWKTELVDAEEALGHFWPSEEIEEALLSIGKRQVANGKREIPGFVITETKETI